MSNILINTTIQDNAIKSNYEVNHKLTPIALPHSDSDNEESSNSSKKSKSFILNNMQNTSPKLKSSYDTNQMTINEQISLYQSLSNTDKNNFLIKNYSDNPSSLYEMYLNMPINDANAFLTKASVVLSDQIIQNYDNLPNDSKQIVNDETYKILSSFINSMPKDMKDECSSNLNKIINAGLKGSSSKGGADPSTLIDIQDEYNGDFTPHAIPIMALIVKAFVGNMNTESLDELEQILKADMINKFLDSVKTQIDEDISKYKGLENTASEGSKGMKIFSIVLLVVTIVVAVAAIVFTGGAALGEVMGIGAEVAEGEESAAVGEEVAEGEESAAVGEDTSAGDGEVAENSQDIKNTDSKWNRLQKGFAQERAQKPFMDGLKTSASRLGKVLVAAGGAYGAGYMVDNVYGKNGQAKQQAELGEYQTDVQASTVQSDTLNNSEQTVSKRIDDDSQRISQSSGYCQQAINMLAQAMSMRA